MVRFAACVLAIGIAMLGGAQADDGSSFYAGKTMSVLIGSTPGGGYDLYARVLTKYLTRHIPGHPAMVPQNMPGAGTLRAAMYLYGVAPKDGTFSRSVPLAPLMQLPGAQFDARTYSWLGSVATDTWTCLAWKDSPVKTWPDLFTAEFKVGGVGRTSDPDVYATLIKNAYTAKIKLVTGYPGTRADHAAILRQAFDATMKDPEFLADAKSHGLNVTPMTGEQVLAMLQQVYTTPDSVVKSVRFVLGY